MSEIITDLNSGIKLEIDDNSHVNYSPESAGENDFAENQPSRRKQCAVNTCGVGDN
jgi:hypothetical protein